MSQKKTPVREHDPDRLMNKATALIEVACQRPARTKEVLELAQQGWIEFAGPEMRSAIRALLADGKPVTEEAAFEQLNKMMRQLVAEYAQESGEDIDELEQRILAAIHAYWTEKGHGPLWSEIQARTDLPGEVFRHALTALKIQKRIYYTKRRRSLTVSFTAYETLGWEIPAGVNALAKIGARYRAKMKKKEAVNQKKISHS